MKQIDRYLQGIVRPECESDPHRQQLRRQILAEVNEKQMHAPRQMSWRLAGAFSAAACILGMATGATGLTFAWRYPAGPAPGNPPQVAVQDTNRATSPQSDADKLARIIESELKGHLDSQGFVYEYVPEEQRLARVVERAEMGGQPTGVRPQMTRLAEDAAARALTAVPKPMDRRPARFKRVQYTLPDGTKVVLSSSEPNEPSKPAPQP